MATIKKHKRLQQTLSPTSVMTHSSWRNKSGQPTILVSFRNKLRLLKLIWFFRKCNNATHMILSAFEKLKFDITSKIEEERRLYSRIILAFHLYNLSKLSSIAFKVKSKDRTAHHYKTKIAKIFLSNKIRFFFWFLQKKILICKIFYVKCNSLIPT